MTAGNPYRRGTFRVASGPAHDPKCPHTYVICSDPEEDGRQVIVSISSFKEKFSDETCIIHAGTHETIIRKSFVFYKHAEIVTHQRLLDGYQSGVLKPREDIDNNTFLRITTGILRARSIDPRVRRFFDEHRRRVNVELNLASIPTRRPKRTYAQPKSKKRG